MCLLYYTFLTYTHAVLYVLMFILILYLSPSPSLYILYIHLVGPETITMIELLERFSYYQGHLRFRPVHVRYNNMEVGRSVVLGVYTH